MSLVIKSDGVPVHYPKRSDHFEFDEEVSVIFEDMAQRSIPMYAQVHRMNAAIIHRHRDRSQGSPYVVWDIGGSTGMAAKALIERLGAYGPGGCMEMAYHVIDVSQPMLDQVHEKLPWVVPHHLDITQAGWTETPGLPQPNCILLNYVLQFVQSPHKTRVIYACAKILRDRGILLLAQKEAVISDGETLLVPVVLEEEYIRFRLDNGYTENEIARKTEALKNSMWLTTRKASSLALFEAGFTSIYETTRWGQFASYACTKPHA